MVDEEKQTAEKSEINPETGKPKKLKAPLKKRLIRIGIIILAVLVVQALVRDVLIETAVERTGTFLLGTNVEVGSFHSSLIGRVRIRNLSVANPPGYNNPYAFQLKEVRVDINPFSLLTNKIRINEIFVAGMGVDYELKTSGSNLGDIQKNLSRFDSASDPDNEALADDNNSDADNAPSKQMVIRDLQITDCSLSFSNSALGTTLRMPLPGIHMENIGDGKPIGETLGDLYNVVFTSVGNGVTGIGGAIGDAAKDAGGAIGNAAKDVGDAVKNLFR